MKLQIEKICKYCSNVFSTTRNNKIYCTNPCAKKSFYLNPKKVKEKYAQGKLYYKKNFKKISKITKLYREVNKEKYTLYLKKWLENKDNKLRYIEKKKNWEKRNRDYTSAACAMRRARKLQATPSWLTLDQKNKILEVYKQAKLLQYKDGIKRHVDHIIPLKSDIVCGLHVPWNLQVLTYYENCKKYNKL